MRLLTCETLEEIDGRFATEPRVIEFYESVFINVRDQLQHRDWVSKVIVSVRSSIARMIRGGMTDEQRGYVYRLFAYFGGPLCWTPSSLALGRQLRHPAWTTSTSGSRTNLSNWCVLPLRWPQVRSAFIRRMSCEC